jgi:hypothetical protein
MRVQKDYPASFVRNEQMIISEDLLILLALDAGKNSATSRKQIWARTHRLYALRNRRSLRRAFFGRNYPLTGYSTGSAHTELASRMR